MSLVRVLSDPHWWYIHKKDATGKWVSTGRLVPVSRFDDPKWRKSFTGDFAYPGVRALLSRPSGGGGSLRIPQRWWDMVREMNTPEIWEKLRVMDYGWLNSAGNPRYETGEQAPDNPDPLPRPEAITSLLNVHRVIDRRNGATRIDAYKFSDPVPAMLDEYKICDFTSIDQYGNVVKMGAKFPLLVAEEAWIPDEALEDYSEENKTMAAELDFVDGSHHNSTIDWLGLRDYGAKGGIVKVSDGYFMPPGGYVERNHFDSEFKTNWEAMVEFELRGAYHFGRLDSAAWRPDTLAEQVSKAIAYIGLPRKAEDVFVLDIEQPASQIAHISLASRQDMVIDALDEAASKWPKDFIWIYTGAWWWGKSEDRNSTDWPYQMPKVISPKILEYPVWCANYPGRLDGNNDLPDVPGQDPYAPDVPNGWTEDQVVAWQYSDRGMIDGKRFDVNDFRWNWDEYFDTDNPTPPPPPANEYNAGWNASKQDTINKAEASKL